MAPANSAARIDFRAAYDDLRYEVYALPDAIGQKCRCLVKQFGLQYGAIDMAVTPDGEYVFFEVNPNGQYQWIEYYTKLPLTEAFIDLLVSGGKGKTDV